MEFKDREQRTQCYSARDNYYECLDKNLIDNKINTATAAATKQPPACRQLLDSFEKSCGKKWTEHFIRKRDYMKFKERVEKEGVELIDKAKI